jgi:hypothetical protein
MKKRILPKNQSSEPIRREKDRTVWRYCFLMLLFGGILVVGFFFAARQHFSAISLGMKNAELRKQRDELQTEERRLKVSREMAFSPVELEKAAKNIGLEKRSNDAFEVASVDTKPHVDSKPHIDAKPSASVKSVENTKHAFAKITKEKPIDTEKIDKNKTLSNAIKTEETKVAKEKLTDKQDSKLNKKGA